LFHSENHVSLSRDVQVAGAARRAATRAVAGVGDLVQRTGDGRTGRVLGGQALRGQVAPCVVCTWHVETRSTVSWLRPKVDGL
jgi:hypothetical protein